MKKLLILAAVIAFSHTAATQNCYVRLDDASGYTPTAGQLAALESAACRLIDSLPAAFQDSFKVYDFGFYLHNETQQGGYPEAFQWAIDTVQGLSPYYLLFGKQTDRSGVYTRFWVDLRLPTTGIFSCLDENEWHFLELNLELTVNVYHQQFQSGQSYFHLSEQEGIAYVLALVEKQEECCFQGAKMTCEIPCMEVDKIRSYFERNGFSSFSASVTQNSSKPENKTGNRSYGRVNDFTGMSIILNGIQYNLESNANQILNEDVNCFPQKNCKIFITQNEQFCDIELISAINGHLSDTNMDLIGWVHIWFENNNPSNAIIFSNFKGKYFRDDPSEFYQGCHLESPIEFKFYFYIKPDVVNSSTYDINSIKRIPNITKKIYTEKNPLFTGSVIAVNNINIIYEDLPGDDLFFDQIYTSVDGITKPALGMSAPWGSGNTGWNEKSLKGIFYKPGCYINLFAYKDSPSQFLEYRLGYIAAHEYLHQMGIRCINLLMWPYNTHITDIKVYQQNAFWSGSHINDIPNLLKNGQAIGSNGSPTLPDRYYENINPNEKIDQRLLMAMSRGLLRHSQWKGTIPNAMSELIIEEDRIWFKSLNIPN